jgi:putative ABC transport system permease protein
MTPATRLLANVREQITRLWGTVRGRPDDRDLQEELRLHVELATEDARRRADSPDLVARDAAIRIGGMAQAMQALRDQRGLPWLADLSRDVRYAIRTLRRSPGFTTVAVLTLGLGVGANTAIFSVIRAVLLEPLPYSQPDRIVSLESIFDSGPAPNLSIPKFMAFREQTGVFQDAALYWAYGGRVNLTGGDPPEQLGGLHVSADYFRLFGASVARGRTFSAEEDRPGGPRVVVISNGLWRRRFGGDPQLVGKSIGVGGVPYEVAGVLGPDFYWDPPVDLWLPLQADLRSTGPSHEYYAAARLKPGVSLEQATAAMKVAFEGFRRKFPSPLAFPANGLTAERMQDVLVRDVRPSLRLLLGTAFFVLLIACTNIANLLLARGAARAHEIAIRAALSAGRGRIIRQLLTESALLSVAGALLGLALGYVGLHVLLVINPGNIPRIGEHGSGIAIDRGLVAFALAVAALTTVLYGLIPAIHASHADLIIILKASGSRTGTGIRQTRTRSLLVVTEIALAIVLLVGSALLIRTYLALRSVKPGFDGHGVLALDMSLDGPRFQEAAEVARVARDGTQRIEALPGVEAAATTWSLPLEPPNDPQFFTIEGRPLAGKPYHGVSDWRLVTRHYFDVFRIPLVRGRSFGDHDDASGAPVVIINRAMANALWPHGNPLGERIWLNKGLGKGFEEAASRLVIGIVGDVKDRGLVATTGPIMYVPVAQVQDNVLPFYSQAFRLMWVVRTRTAPFSLSEEIQRRLREASGGLPVGHVRSMEQVRGESTARTDFTASLFSVFAGLALLMAAIGIYGVMAYAVEQRTREIGIRMALGAPPSSVRGMVLAEGAVLTLVGTVVGVSAALTLTRFMASLLFGVTAWDPVAFAAVIILLSTTALLAAYVPARRAMRVNPIVALRYE